MRSPLDWSRGGDAVAYTAGFGLALGPGNQFSVTGAPWAGLTGVPAGFADGTDDVDGGTAAALACAGPAGCVSSTEVHDGALTAADLAGGAVTFAKLAADVVGRIVGLEDRAADLEARAAGLAAAPAPGDTDRLHTARLTGHVSATTPLGPGPVPAGTRTAHVLPVIGVEVGDFVTVSPPADLANNLLFVGHDVVTAVVDGEVVDQLVVYLYNALHEPVDDVQRTWKAQYLDLTP